MWDNIKTADYTVLEAIFHIFKALNITFSRQLVTIDAFLCRKSGIKIHCSARRSLVETFQWVKHEQTWPFLHCHLELSLPGVLGASKPHLQSLLSQSQGKGQLSLTGIPSGLSVREEMATRAAQADTHLKPSQFNEAQHVGANKSCLSLLFSQNRFQALLDEIIQQEEREMEQVRTFP